MGQNDGSAQLFLGRNRTERDPVKQVFDFWASKQRRPHVCKLTKERRELIHSRLGLGYTPDDLIHLIEYAYEAQTDEAMWWRGANPIKRSYLRLENLLRKNKLGDRVEASANWREDISGPAKTDPSAVRDSFGPLEFFRAGDK